MQDPEQRAASEAPPAKPFNDSDPFAMRWSERAHDLVNEGKLKVSITTVGAIKVALADGECPYCGDQLRDVRSLTAVTEGSDRVLGTGVAAEAEVALRLPMVKYEDVTFTCGCSVVHPGGKKGQTGCGTHFRLSIPVTS